MASICDEQGRGNIWLPLKLLRCGTAAVTAIAHDESCGLLLAADASGSVAIWELFDEKENLSAVNMLAKIYNEAVDIILKQLEKKEEDQVLNDDSRFIEDYAKYWYRFYKYHPSTFRALIKCQLPPTAGHVTCGLLLSNVLSVVVGTELGALFYFSDIRNSSFSKVEIELDRFDSANFELCRVVSLTLSTFPLNGKSIPVVYCAFLNGHILALELKNWTVLFISAGHGEIYSGDSEKKSGQSHSKASATARQLNDDDDASGGEREDEEAATADAAVSDHAVDLHVLNEDFELIAKPDLISICRYRLVPDLPDDLPTSAEKPSASLGNSSNAATASRLSSLLFSKGKSSSALPENNVLPSSPSSSHASSVQGNDPTAAKHAVLVRDGRLYLYTLSEVRLNAYQSPLGGRYLSLPLQTILWAAQVSKRSPITRSSVLLTYQRTAAVESEGIEEDSPSFLALACLTSDCELAFAAVKKEPSLVLQVPLLDGVLDRPAASAEAAVVLPNGNCYLLLSGGKILLSSAAVSNTHSLPCPLPEKASAECQAQGKGRSLLHGREHVVEKVNLALKKRRQSMLSIAAGPTDLSKLFSKTRDVLQKEELLGDTGRF